MITTSAALRRTLTLTDQPAPTSAPPAAAAVVELPDVMPERVGTVVTIIGAAGAGKGTKVPDRE